jgi:hypothetical protein
LCSFQIDQTFFLLPPQPCPFLAHFCSWPNSRKSVGVPPIVALARLRCSSPAPQLGPAGPRPPPARSAPLPRPQRLIGGARLSSPTPHPWPSRTRARVRLRAAPAVLMPSRAWPAR